MAIFDIWGKSQKQPLSSLFGLFHPTDEAYKRKGFYTAALNADIQKTISVIQAEASNSTKYLKIKINNDVTFVSQLLQALHEAFPHTGVT